MATGNRETAMTRKGQITIPLPVRQALGLKPKDKVRFEQDGDTFRIVRASSKMLEAYGSIAKGSAPDDWCQVREQFERGVAEEVLSED